MFTSPAQCYNSQTIVNDMRLAILEPHHAVFSEFRVFFTPPLAYVIQCPEQCQSSIRAQIIIQRYHLIFSMCFVMFPPLIKEAGNHKFGTLTLPSPQQNNFRNATFVSASKPDTFSQVHQQMLPSFLMGQGEMLFLVLRHITDGRGQSQQLETIERDIKSKESTSTHFVSVSTIKIT